MRTCEGGGREKRSRCCVAYQGLSQFKLRIAGLELVTVKKPNCPLTAWTLTGNLRTETSTDVFGEKAKMVWTIWKSFKLDKSWLLKSEHRSGWGRGSAAEQTDAGGHHGDRAQHRTGSGGDSGAKFVIFITAFYLSGLFCFLLLVFSPSSLWICHKKGQTQVLLAALWLAEPGKMGMRCRDIPWVKQKPPQRRGDGQITAAACPLTTRNCHAWTVDTKNYHVSLGDYCIFLILRLGSHQWEFRDERRNILSSGEYIFLLIATVDLGGWGHIFWSMKRIHSSHKLWKNGQGKIYPARESG